MGAPSALAIPKAKVPWAILGIGGLLAIAGFVWGLSDTRDGGIAGVSGIGYGLYLTLAGGILGLFGFLRCCGTIQAPVQEPGAQPGITDNKIVGGIGLIAGILALVGVFGPWATYHVLGYHPSISAWDAITGLTTGDNRPLYEVWAGLALHGAILALVGALSALAAPKAKVPWGILGAGRVVVITGCAWGLSDIRAGSVHGLSGIGYGLYVTLVGGMLGLIGFLRLKRLIWFPRQAGAESK